MSNGIKTPTVREYVSPQDSAAVLDYMVDVLRFPEDIHDFYSKDIGSQPLNFHLNEMLAKEDLLGQVSTGTAKYHSDYPPNAHAAVDTLISKMGTPFTTHTAVDTTFAPYHGAQSEKSSFGKQLAEKTYPFVVSPEYLETSFSPRQTIIHEVFGHLLPRRYRADEKKVADDSFPTFYGKSELMAELLETIAAEEGDTSAAKLKDFLEPIVQKELKKEFLQKEFKLLEKGNIPASYAQNPNIQKRKNKLDQFLETIQGWFGY